MPIKQITLHGENIMLHYSPETRTWCSKIADVIAMKRKKEELEKKIKTISRNIPFPKGNFLGDSPEWCDVHLPGTKSGRSRIF